MTAAAAARRGGGSFARRLGVVGAEAAAEAGSTQRHRRQPRRREGRGGSSRDDDDDDGGDGADGCGEAGDGRVAGGVGGSTTARVRHKRAGGLLALISISSEIFTPKSSDFVGSHTTQKHKTLEGPMLSTSTCQADKHKRSHY
jgi:hypothetical protein